MNNIAKYLGLVADADNAADLAKMYTSTGFKNYSKSITTYVTYYASSAPAPAHVPPASFGSVVTPLTD